MKVPISWLKEYVDVAAPAGDLARALVMAGAGVESVEGDVLDLEITANRADLLSMIGVAREAGLIFRKSIRIPEVNYREAADPVSFKVEVADPDLSPRYTARMIRNVKVGPSPSWMVERLQAAGIRSINNVVDVTNYVLLEIGQPLHAFDAKRLRGGTIVVRRARPGEKMAALDDKEYELTKEMLVIADAERPVAIAGVMGGRETEIGPGTTDVLIESAQFDPVSVRRTSRRLGLSSESSYRFERGVDYDGVDWASRRAVQLIAELAKGEPLKGAVDVSRPRPERPAARVRVQRVRSVLGLDVGASRVFEILSGLGCKVTAAEDAIRAEAPPGRRDLRIEADYIEEIARIEGYDKIPCDTSFVQRVAVDNKEDLVQEETRAALTGLGAYEVLTWSFAEANAPGLIPLRDPQGQVDRTLRESLVPGFLRVLQTNESYKEELRPIFEIACIYRREPNGYGEKTVLGLAAPGDPLGVKGLLEALFGRLGVEWNIVPKGLEPGCGAEVLASGCKVGYVGMPAGGAADLCARVSVAEIDFQELVRAARLSRPYREFNRQPPVVRDLAIVVAEGILWRDVEGAVRAAAPATLESIRFLSEYRGKGIEPGQKSLAFSMVFRAPDRTLTAEEVEPAVRGVLKALEAKTRARLR